VGNFSEEFIFFANNQTSIGCIIWANYKRIVSRLPENIGYGCLDIGISLGLYISLNMGQFSIYRISLMFFDPVVSSTLALTTAFTVSRKNQMVAFAETIVTGRSNSQLI
jgi:hypothetical protein